MVATAGLSQPSIMEDDEKSFSDSSNKLQYLWESISSPVLVFLQIKQSLGSLCSWTTMLVAL
jgi:hypothetical protein